MTAETKLVRFSLALRTSSSAVLAFSLPAWTSTLRHAGEGGVRCFGEGVHTL